VHHWPLWSWQESNSGQYSFYVSIRFLFIGFQGLWESYLLSIFLSSCSCYITLLLSTVF
jgi:ABC-type proline/glycine betaine transport system permease subunit